MSEMLCETSCSNIRDLLLKSLNYAQNAEMLISKVETLIHVTVHYFTMWLSYTELRVTAGNNF